MNYPCAVTTELCKTCSVQFPSLFSVFVGDALFRIIISVSGGSRPGQVSGTWSKFPNLNENGQKSHFSLGFFDSEPSQNFVYIRHCLSSSSSRSSSRSSSSSSFTSGSSSDRRPSLKVFTSLDILPLRNSAQILHPCFSSRQH